MIKVSVVIPCYNEEDSLPELFKKLTSLSGLCEPRFELEYIFVNDGSRDGTARLLEGFCRERTADRVVSHESNRGFGGALRSGLAAARGEWVVTIDADSNYNHMEIPILLDFIGKGADVVTASPWGICDQKQNFPIHRYIYSRTLSWIYRRFLKRSAPDIHTFTSGFRLYRREVIETVEFRADNFIATAELLIRAIKAGYRVQEYPTTVYERKFGHSKLKTLPTILGHLKLIRRLWLDQGFVTRK